MTEKIKLTEYSTTSGWASKMGPDALLQVLQHVEFTADDDQVLVGLDKADDAVAYQLNEEQVIINSVDFFTPVVNDPYLYGQIAAANALSDVYAMGGKPLLAMNIVCFPSCLDNQILEEILQGGADKVAEAGAIVAGGHTIEDDEPKYGLSVTGEVKPENLVVNSQAQIGDKLILTKPVGTGVIATALKADMLSAADSEPAFKSMKTLNNKPVVPMQEIGVNACTDITGFGLLGHSWELASGSGVEVTIEAEQVPILPKAKEQAAMGLVPAGSHRNKDYLEDKIDITSEIEEAQIDLLFDPQTSGGLLISVAPEKVADLLVSLEQAEVETSAVVGEVTGQTPQIKVK